MKIKKIIYYSDEINDDFANNNINTKQIENNFKYIHKSIFWKIAVIIIYRLIATPVALFTCHILYGAKIYNRKALRNIGKKGVFMYGNHTQAAFDAFIPSLISFPRRNLVVAGPDAFSIKYLKTIVQIVGGIPTPNTLKNMSNFTECLKYSLEQNNSVTTYPEAHIWPYYTGIRPFKSASFYSAAKLNSPVIAFAVTYRERKLFKNLAPRINVYVSDPFYSNQELSTREASIELRKQVFNFIKDKTCNVKNAEYYKYIKK